MRCLRLIVLCTFFTAGCSTLMVRDPGAGCGGDGGPKGLYPATQGDFRSIGWICSDLVKEHPLEAIPSLLMCVIDIPFSLIFDTVLLPYDLTHLQRGKSTAAESKESGSLEDHRTSP